MCHRRCRHNLYNLCRRRARHGVALVAGLRGHDSSAVQKNDRERFVAPARFRALTLVVSEPPFREVRNFRFGSGELLRRKNQCVGRFPKVLVLKPRAGDCFHRREEDTWTHDSRQPSNLDFHKNVAKVKGADSSILMWSLFNHRSVPGPVILI
jgi:hypothetical protein